jgi:hypothetical protein
MNYILSQIIGAAGYLLLAYSFFKEKKKQILYIQILAYLCFTIHYFLIDAITGTICNIIGGLALVLIYFFSNDEKKKKVLVLSLIILVMAMAVLSYENIYSIFPVLACLVTFSSFLSKKEDVIRFIGIVSAFFWLIYELAHGSYIAIAFEVITVISTTVAYKKNKK